MADKDSYFSYQARKQSGRRGTGKPVGPAATAAPAPSTPIKVHEFSCDTATVKQIREAAIRKRLGDERSS